MVPEQSASAHPNNGQFSNVQDLTANCANSSSVLSSRFSAFLASFENRCSDCCISLLSWSTGISGTRLVLFSPPCGDGGDYDYGHVRAHAHAPDPTNSDSVLC